MVQIINLIGDDIKLEKKNDYVENIKNNPNFDGFKMAFDLFELNKNQIVEDRKKFAEETNNTFYSGLDGFQNQQKYKKIIPDTVEYDVDGAEAYVEIFKTVLEKKCEELEIDEIKEDNGRYVIKLNSTDKIPEDTDIRLDTLYPFTELAKDWSIVKRNKENKEEKSKEEIDEEIKDIVDELFTRTRTIGGMLPIPHIKSDKLKNMSLNSARGIGIQKDNPTDHMVFVKRWYELKEENDYDSYKNDSSKLANKLNDCSLDKANNNTDYVHSVKVATSHLVAIYREYDFWFDAIGSYDNYVKLLHLEAFDPYSEGGVAFTQMIYDYDDKFLEDATKAFEKRSESIVECYNAAIEENK